MNARTLTMTVLAAAALLALPAAGQTEQPRCCSGDTCAMTAAYDELPDPAPRGDGREWQEMPAPVMLRWGTNDTRYAKHRVPDGLTGRSIRLKAWRGERVTAQAVMWSRRQLDDVALEVAPLRGRRVTLPEGTARAAFVRYVMTDELNKDGKGGCGERPDKTEWDSLLVADVIDIAPMLDVEACSAQPLWLTIDVPRDARAGTYKSSLTVRAQGMADQRLAIELEVVDRTLPEPRDWQLDLDLWQNPYAVARYYDVSLWSDKHFEAMRPIMTMLASAGQESVTATIMHKPWNGQTYDHYDSMVGKTRHIDGTWSYDYTVFDKWVEFMAECGIDGRINCYTMVPWALSFDYYDQATARLQFVKAEPGQAAFTDYWLPFLKDFAAHLRAKGWFDKTYISMDERPLEAMKATIAVIRQADADYKIALAGNYHEEIQADLDYLSIPFGQTYPSDVLAARRAKGQISAYYTCCTEAFPNTFTFSPPAEAAWTALHTLAGDYDGYLRWAVMSWTEHPLLDSRFRTWAAGDTYSIYPGPRSSLRFELLLQGLQDCAKIAVLRSEFTAAGDAEPLELIENHLDAFTPEGMSATQPASAAQHVREMHDLLNEL